MGRKDSQSRNSAEKGGMVEYQTTFAVVNQRSAEAVESDRFLSALQQDCRRSPTDGHSTVRFAELLLLPTRTSCAERSVTVVREQRVGIYQKNSYVNDSAEELI
jgi:hypothetical protein